MSNDVGNPDHCPKCGSKEIRERTTREGDWACRDCGSNFFADDPDGPTDAERAEAAMKAATGGEPYLVVGVGVYLEGEEEDGSPQRFAEEFTATEGWEQAEAMAKDEHPDLTVAAVLKVEDGKARVCDVEARRTPGEVTAAEMRAECEYSDGSDGEGSSGVDSLIAYKNACEERMVQMIDGPGEACRLLRAWRENPATDGDDASEVIAQTLQVAGY